MPSDGGGLLGAVRCEYETDQSGDEDCEIGITEKKERSSLLTIRFENG